MLDLMEQLRANGPVNPAVQMRTLLGACRARDWEFEMAWRWSWERVRWPHDTCHRLEWKDILGTSPVDDRRMPRRQRDVWQRAYELAEQSSQEQATSRLVAA